jgi:hypothetical protein
MLLARQTSARDGRDLHLQGACSLRCFSKGVCARIYSIRETAWPTQQDVVVVVVVVIVVALGESRFLRIAAVHGGGSPRRQLLRQLRRLALARRQARRQARPPARACLPLNPPSSALATAETGQHVRAANVSRIQTLSAPSKSLLGDTDQYRQVHVPRIRKAASASIGTSVHVHADDTVLVRNVYETNCKVTKPIARAPMM